MTKCSHTIFFNREDVGFVHSWRYPTAVDHTHATEAPVTLIVRIQWNHVLGRFMKPNNRYCGTDPPSRPETYCFVSEHGSGSLCCIFPLWDTPIPYLFLIPDLKSHHQWQTLHHSWILFICHYQYFVSTWNVNVETEIQLLHIGTVIAGAGYRCSQ